MELSSAWSVKLLLGIGVASHLTLELSCRIMIFAAVHEATGFFAMSNHSRKNLKNS